jgi:ankyrin repeat protein
MLKLDVYKSFYLQSFMSYLGDDDPFDLIADAIDTKSKRSLRRLRELIVGGKVDINACVDEITLLGQVAEAGDLELVSLMLSLGADVNFREIPKVSTPLIDATIGGNLKIVKLLIQSGADPNIAREGTYPLECAAFSANRKMFNYLLPLTREDWREDAKNLLKSEIEKKSKKLDLPTKKLFKALENDNILGVQKSLAEGADINAVNEYGRSVLAQALFYHVDHQIGDEIFRRVDIEIIKLLLHSGADLVKSDAVFYGLQYALYSKNPTPPVAMNLLLESIPNDSDRYHWGGRLLSNLVPYNTIDCLDMLRFILSKVVDVNVKNENGFTALNYAKGNKNQKAIKILIEAGANE